MINMKCLIACIMCCCYAVVARAQTSNKPMTDFYSPGVQTYLAAHPPKQVKGKDFKVEKLPANDRNIKQEATKKNKNPQIKPHHATGSKASRQSKLVSNDPELMQKIKKVKKVR